MTVTIQQIQTGVTQFIEQEIAQKAVGFKKFTVYFMLPQVVNKVPGLIESYRSNQLFADLFNETGNVDLDKLYNMAKVAIAKSGQIELAGIIFNETDVDKLYSYIRNTSIQGGN